MMPKCLACGDWISPRSESGLARLTQIPFRGQSVSIGRFCEECASELLLGEIPEMGTTMHGCGGGKRVIRDPRSLGG